MSCDCPACEADAKRKAQAVRSWTTSWGTRPMKVTTIAEQEARDTIARAIKGVQREKRIVVGGD